MAMDKCIEDMRDRIGISTDGWTPAEEFDKAVSKNNQHLKQLSAPAVDDRDQELSLRHYPFIDRDEEK